jgi:hypothetical protein
MCLMVHDVRDNVSIPVMGVFAAWPQCNLTVILIESVGLLESWVRRAVWGLQVILFGRRHNTAESQRNLQLEKGLYLRSTDFQAK